jgi:hypothetical protein
MSTLTSSELAPALALNEAKELDHIDLHAARACLWQPFFSPLLLPNFYSPRRRRLLPRGRQTFMNWRTAGPQGVAVPHPLVSLVLECTSLLPSHAEPGMRLTNQGLPNQTMGPLQLMAC